MVSNKLINGTFGRVWVNGELFANVKSFEAKLTGDYEDVTQSGELGTHRKYMGYSIEGTVTLYKLDSTIARLISEGFRTGALPEISIVGKIEDPAAYGAERVELIEVTFDELMLLKFENKTVTEEEVPFKAAAFNYLDMI